MEEELSESISSEKRIKIVLEKKQTASISSKWYIQNGKNHFLKSSVNLLEWYLSTRYEKLRPDRPFVGERNCISVSADEIAVYDLYLNTLAANSAKSFQYPPDSSDSFPEPLIFSIDNSMFIQYDPILIPSTD